MIIMRKELIPTSTQQCYFFFSVYDVCDPQYFTPEVCAQQPQNRLLAGYPYSLGLGLSYPYAIAASHQCGCPLRAGEANLQNIRWNLPALGLAHAVVRLNKITMSHTFYFFNFQIKLVKATDFSIH